MHSDTKRLYIITAIYVAMLLLVCFVPDKTTQIRSLAFFSVISAVGICHFVKKRNIHNLHKKQAALILAAFAACSVALYFIAGAKFGYYRVSVSYSSLPIYIIPVAATVIGTETVRSVFLAQKSKLVRAVVFFTCLTVDALILTEVRAFSSFKNFTDTLTLVVLPCAVSNFLYHHVSERFGATATVPYKLILFLYPYIFSVRPLMPDALLAFAKTLIPVVIYFTVCAVYKTGGRITAKTKRRLGVTLTAVLAALAISFIMLISGQFQYKMIVIATESMTGTIDRGDAVIYEAYGEQTLKPDDIIVFDRGDGALIVHRIVEINNIDGEIRYYTKGDANASADDGYLTDGQIVGVTRLKIMYMGYPSLWFRSLFK